MELSHAASYRMGKGTHTHTEYRVTAACWNPSATHIDHEIDTIARTN